MPIIRNATLAKLRAGQMAVGFGAFHLRSVATPALARAAGYDWLFIDMEHGAFSVHEATQLAMASLAVGITPIVRVCTNALDEGTRALDNGAQGIVVPHVDTPELARRVAEAFHFPPQGKRSWGGGVAIYGYLAPDAAIAQDEINGDVLIIAMIETAEAVGHAEAIAATPGIDVLFIGSSDLTADMGISGQMDHPRVIEAYRTVIAACRRHGKVAGMGGIYDEENARRYIGMGARFVFAGTDQMFLLAGATERARFLTGLG
jgi:2-keto-3-deoxy-L-rhamnonate aldolase RhmA